MSTGPIAMTTLRASSASSSSLTPSAMAVKEEEEENATTHGPVRTTYPTHDENDDHDEGRGLIGQ